MGDRETLAPADVESPLEYHTLDLKVLTMYYETSTGTLSVGQFDWGGRLLKSNGGVQRFAQTGRKPVKECKGKSELNCDTDKWSRYESRT